MDANTTGQYNVAVGHNSLGSNTTSNDNVAVGTNALTNLTVGGASNVGQNTAVGNNALQLVCYNMLLLLVMMLQILTQLVVITVLWERCFINNHNWI